MTYSHSLTLSKLDAFKMFSSTFILHFISPVKQPNGWFNRPLRNSPDDISLSSEIDLEIVIIIKFLHKRYQLLWKCLFDVCGSFVLDTLSSFSSLISVSSVLVTAAFSEWFAWTMSQSSNEYLISVLLISVQWHSHIGLCMDERRVRGPPAVSLSF